MKFWNFVGFITPLQGILLSDYNWGVIWRKLGKKVDLPDFRLNLLIQAKRADFLYGTNKEYSKNGIKGCYYRFMLTEHQQKALEKISHRLGRKALVCYAAPAFHTNKELFSYITNTKLIENSTFVQAHKLRGHEKWVYDTPGCTGLACSEVEKISDIPLEEQIDKLRELDYDKGEVTKESAAMNIIELYRLLTEAIHDNELNENIIISELKERLILLKDNINRKTEVNEEVFSFCAINMIFELLNISWNVIS